MKKYILLLLMLVVAGIFNYYAPSRTQLIRVGVECDHEPYNWEEDSPTDSNFPLANNPGFYVEGYDVQIAKIVADEIGATVEFHKIDFNNLIPALTANEIDAIFSGMVDTEARRSIIAFTEPYEVKKVEYIVLVNKNSKYSGAKTLQDFRGAKFIGQKDSRFDEVIDQIRGVQHLPPLEAQSAVVNEVIKLNADATVVNDDTGLSYELSNPALKVIHFPEGRGFHLGFTGLCAGVRKTDLALLRDINKALHGLSTRQRQRIMDLSTKRVWEQ